MEANQLIFEHHLLSLQSIDLPRFIPNIFQVKRKDRQEILLQIVEEKQILLSLVKTKLLTWLLLVSYLLLKDV